MKQKEISIGWAMKQPDVSAALDRVFANIRSFSGKSKTWLDGRSDYFPPFSLPFGRKVLSLPMLTNGESIHPVGHRLIVRQYCRAFFMPSLYRYRRLPFRKYTAHWVKSLFVSNGMCSRFLYLRAGGTGDAYKQCYMQLNDISIGWALKQPDVSAALDRVFANIRSFNDKSKTWLDGRSDYFPPFSLPFGRKVLSLHCSNNGGYIHSVGHRSIVRQYCRAFFMPSLYRYRRLPFRTRRFARWVKPLLFEQRDVQPLSVSPCRRNRRCSNNSAIMRQKEISIGWALKQPDVSAALDRVFANIRSFNDKSKTWLDGESETFTALCGTEGDRFTRRDVLKGHLYLVALFFIMCVAGWLEGGAV